MTDLLSWKPPAARATDPSTSHDAAKDATMGASVGRLAAMRCLSIRPLTDFELAEATGIQQTSIGKRRGECAAHGLVEKALDGRGEEVRRPTPTGSGALVWQVTEAGRNWYAAQVNQNG